jgi:pimeloyl-ACP methyl ester carboxylesterase
VIEHVHSFGSHGGLVGIVTEPSPDLQRPGAPVVVFSNIGLNHRVGPNRLYVELARQLAAAGFASLRFDLSGFGDSEPRRTGGMYLERATLDTREAMDFLQKRGSSRFVVVGLCSGVDSAHTTAMQDSRVVGGIFIEGYAYRNAGFWLRFLTVRNLQPARWRRYVRVRVARLMGKLPLPDLDDVPEIFARELPSQQQFAGDLAALVKRSVKMLFIYTINTDGAYNYARQFHDTFGYRDVIDVEFYTRADHVFSSEPRREMLLSRLVQWMEVEFPRESFAAAQRGRRATATIPALCVLGSAAILTLNRLMRLMADTTILGA